MRRSYTAVLARNEAWEGRFETEPYEAAWASEAIFFLRLLKGRAPDGSLARVQISPDGLRWCDEGSKLAFPEDSEIPTFVRVREFGGWLRLVGELPAGSDPTVIAYLSLKE